MTTISANELREIETLLIDAIGLLEAEKGNVQYHDLTNRCLRIIAHVNYGEKFLEHFKEVKPYGGSVCAKAFMMEGPVISYDVEHDASFTPHLEIARMENFRSVISVPIVRNKIILGMLSAQHHKPGWDWQLSKIDSHVVAIGKILQQILYSRA